MAARAAARRGGARSALATIGSVWPRGALPAWRSAASLASGARLHDGLLGVLPARRCLSSPTLSSPSQMPVSEKRLRQFLEAEVSHFAAMQRKPLTLEDLLCAAASPQHAARMVHQEIPKHFAARIRQIEVLENWSTDESLVALHSCYYESFRDMRMTEVGDDLSSFTGVVRALKERQRCALHLVGQVLKRRKVGAEPEMQARWADWLRTFLKSRISTEMLTSQYIAIIGQAERGLDHITGIVDPECDPAAICSNVAEAARKVCLQNTGVLPLVDIEVRSKHSHAFSYIPIYLHYILLEVLKNSCAATARSYNLSSVADPLEGNPIKVVICSDDHRVAVRISDMGGGIPFDVGEKVWDFGFTGKGKGTGGQADPMLATPLAGYGLGLPLARLYANYLGGDLSLVSLPLYGCDTYLFLPRIDTTPYMAH